MSIALRLSQRALGMVWPNPSVGCVLVNNGRIIGQGWTKRGAHAEMCALRSASHRDVKGCDVYVTLEPCSHYGRTYPCVQALIDAGVARVFVAVTDPCLTVSSVDLLRQAGIKVHVGLMARQAVQADLGFFKRIRTGLPYILVKIVTSADGCSSMQSGDSQWIYQTGKYSHLLRKQHDAILVGKGTLLSDNPTLNVRLDGMQHYSPLRVVLMRQPNNVHILSNIARTARRWPVWVLHCQKHDDYNMQLAKESGVHFYCLPDLEPWTVARHLGQLGINSVLVEGGSRIWSSFIKHKCFDKLQWIYANSFIGSQHGAPALGDINVMQLSDKVPLCLDDIKSIRDIRGQLGIVASYHMAS